MASAARCSAWMRGMLLQRSSDSKPKAASAATPGSGSRKTGRPASSLPQAGPSQGASIVRADRPGPEPEPGPRRKSIGSNGRQRPPQRFEVPPSRRATAISGGWWVSGECSPPPTAPGPPGRPARPLSSSSTRRPRPASASAVTIPTGPAPITQISAPKPARRHGKEACCSIIRADPRRSRSPRRKPLPAGANRAAAAANVPPDCALASTGPLRNGAATFPDRSMLVTFSRTPRDLIDSGRFRL